MTNLKLLDTPQVKAWAFRALKDRTQAIWRANLYTNFINAADETPDPKLYHAVIFSQSLAGQSLSHATLKPDDLIESFTSFLDTYGVKYETGDLRIPDEADWFLNETLFDLLNEIAPPNHYFGAHPGDGSDFGFWEIEDDI